MEVQEVGYEVCHLSMYVDSAKRYTLVLSITTISSREVTIALAPALPSSFHHGAQSSEMLSTLQPKVAEPSNKWGKRSDDFEEPTFYRSGNTRVVRWDRLS